MNRKSPRYLIYAFQPAPVYGETWCISRNFLSALCLCAGPLCDILSFVCFYKQIFTYTQHLRSKRKYSLVIKYLPIERMRNSRMKQGQRCGWDVSWGMLVIYIYLQPSRRRNSHAKALTSPCKCKQIIWKHLDLPNNF